VTAFNEHHWKTHICLVLSLILFISFYILLHIRCAWKKKLETGIFTQDRFLTTSILVYGITLSFPWILKMFTQVIVIVFFITLYNFQNILLHVGLFVSIWNLQFSLINVHKKMFARQKTWKYNTVDSRYSESRGEQKKVRDIEF